MAWHSSDAERWRALRPGRWAHPILSVLALALASITALWLAPADAYFCRGEEPCPPDWLGTAMEALVAAVLYRGIKRLPLATIAILPLVAVWALLDPDTPTAAGVTMAVAACYVCLACTHRLTAARRQRRLATETAGLERYPLPEAAMPRPAEGRNLGCGIVMGVIAVLAFVLGPLGVTSFMSSDGWQAIAFLGSGVALLGLSYYVRDRRRAAALRCAPVPALRVLVRKGGGRNDGRTYILAADDVEGSRPLLSCYVRLASGEYRSPVHNRLREAVLFGPPHPGGGLVLVSSDGQEAPRLCVECDAGPARQEYPEGRLEPPPPGAAAVSWGAGIGSRLCAVLGQCILIALTVGGLAIHGDVPLGLRLYAAGFIFIGTILIITQFSWRITADSAGLWCVGVRRVRLIPWGRSTKSG
ncbi:hypothetical protein ACFQ0G_51220 [Streptomyces chiangmaiensis]